MNKFNKYTRTSNVFFYSCNEKNKKGESLNVILTLCKDCKDKNSIIKLWKKHGYIKEPIQKYWSVETFVRDTEGNVFGLYNPQVNFTNATINFDWIRDATDANKVKILEKVYSLFMSAEGKTATEEKIDRIKDFAAKHKIDIYSEIPTGWKKTEPRITAPNGTIMISNMKSIFSKKRKIGILLQEN